MLDKIRTVNYGDCALTNGPLGTINPLLCCSEKNRIDLVKLLVEKYDADIEYLSWNGKTAIMYSAEEGHVLVTKYLYDKGAQLNVGTKHINNLADAELKELIAKWEANKIQSSPKTNCTCNLNPKGIVQETESNDVAQIRADYLKLKQENDAMKQKYDAMKHKYETIINLLQNYEK